MELYLDHISKKYKDKVAVDDVSLRLTPGVWGAAGRQRRRKNNIDADDCRHYASDGGAGEI